MQRVLAAALRSAIVSHPPVELSIQTQRHARRRWHVPTAEKGDASAHIVWDKREHVLVVIFSASVCCLCHPSASDSVACCHGCLCCKQDAFFRRYVTNGGSSFVPVTKVSRAALSSVLRSVCKPRHDAIYRFVRRWQVMSSVSEDVEVHTEMVSTLRSIFVHGRDSTSISEGFLGSVRELAGASLVHVTAHPAWRPALSCQCAFASSHCANHLWRSQCNPRVARYDAAVSCT